MRTLSARLCAFWKAASAVTAQPVTAEKKVPVSGKPGYAGLKIAKKFPGGLVATRDQSLRLTRLVYFSLVGLIGINSVLFGQPAEELFRLYDGGNTPGDLFADVYQTTDGDYLLCGQKSYHPWLVRVTHEGELIWSIEQAGVRLFSVIDADNGDALTTGTIGEEGEFGVIRVDRDGNIVWTQRYVDGRGTAIIELKEGDFVVCGLDDRGGYACRIDGNGELSWENHYNCRMLQSQREAEDGIVMVGAGRNNEGFAAKTTLDGEMVWQITYPRNDGRSAIYFKSVVSIQGGFAIGGLHMTDNHQDFAICRINSQGEILSQSLLNLGGDRYNFESLNKLSDGGLILVGYKDAGRQYPLAVRLNDEDNILWTVDWADSVNRRGFQDGDLNQLYSVIVSEDDEITACGDMMSLDGRRAGDGLLVRFGPDRPGPIIIRKSPEDSLLTVLQSDSIEFIVRARNRSNTQIDCQWLLSEEVIGEDTSITIAFDELGVFPAICRVSDEDATIEITWHVTVTDLFIAAHTPDTLDLTLRRGSTVDFSIDSVAAIEDEQPISFQWTLIPANEQAEVIGEDSSVTIDFLRSGNYVVEGMAYRGDSHDEVVWDVEVRGAIRSFLPEELTVERLEGDNVEFQIIPTISDSLNWFTWLYDGGMIREGWDSVFVMNFFELGEHTITGVLADSVESDSVSWTVLVESNSVPPSLSLEPLALSLSVSPNPFNSMLTIRFSVGAQGLAPLRLAVYDLSGREVARLLDSKSEIRNQKSEIIWNASSLPAGVYLVRLQQGEQISTKKVVLLR